MSSKQYTYWPGEVILFDSSKHFGKPEQVKQVEKRKLREETNEERKQSEGKRGGWLEAERRKEEEVKHFCC